MSNRRWTPYDIEIVLHHYCSQAKFERWAAPAYTETLRMLCDRGVLEYHSTRIEAEESGVTVTEVGKRWVEMLLATPLPRMVYIDPRDGKEVLEESISPAYDRNTA